MRTQLLAALSRRAATHTRHRTLPAECHAEALGRHQPPPARPTGSHRQRHRRALVQDFLRLSAAERSGAPCPPVLGIDEHFFTRRLGYATTFCDLKGHKVFDVVLGRSEAALESCLQKLPGKEWVRVVCMDRRRPLSRDPAGQPSFPGRTRNQCADLVPRFLKAIHQLRHSGLAQLVQGLPPLMA